MADLKFITKQNDLKNPLIVRLRRGDGSTPPIAGLADDKFEFNLKLPDGSKQTFATAVVNDVADARIKWPLDSALAATVGNYEVEVEVQWSGPTATETFPVCDTLTWVVVAEIG